MSNYAALTCGHVLCLDTYEEDGEDLDPKQGQKVRSLVRDARRVLDLIEGCAK